MEGDNVSTEETTEVAVDAVYNIDKETSNQNTDNALNEQIEHVISLKSNNEKSLAGANHSSDKLVNNVSVDSKNKMAVETLNQISLSVLNKQIEQVSIRSQCDIKKVLANSDNSSNKENEYIAVPAVDPENNVEIKNNDDVLNMQNEHVMINLQNGDEKLLANSDNTSNEQIEHMKSLRVLVERTKYYDCKKCYSVFLNPYKLTLHSVKHINPKRNLTEDDDDRFVKRFKCEECSAKFVQLSTLEEHGALHRPRAHACHCGVDFYLKKDLAAHMNLVHSAQIDQEIAHLNFRQKRAIKNEIWLPHINYTGPKIKEDIKSEDEDDEDDEEEEEEPRRGVRPRLKAQLIKKQKKKPRSTANNPKIKRIKSKVKSLDIKPNSDKTYSCPHCQKVFKAKRNVEMHQVVHTGEKPYSCHLCEKKYTQPANLNLHLKKHMGIKEFCCLVCNKEFLQSDNLKRHIRTHTGEKPYSCTFCEKAFSDPSAFARHTRTHTGVKPYACIYCGMRFSDASGLIAHRRIHEGNKQHQCKDCSKWFYSNDALKKHVISIHERTKNYECKICSKSFALPGYLYIHNKNAHRENKDTYECDHCDYKSDIKYNLRHHIERKHMNLVFLCKECGRSFKHRNYLRNHQNQMHRRLQKYECDECAKIFNRKVDIYRHILSNHPSVKCSKCSRAFANSLDLKKHYLTGCVQCNDCGQRFPDKLKLKHHIFSLHLIYLYCHICNKSFHSTTELQQHKITTNGDCKTTCEICNQPVSKRYMRQHLLIHMGDKRYSCAHCISSFSDKHALQRHLRLSHKYLFLVKKKKKLYRRNLTEDDDDRFVKRFKCEECSAKFVQLSTLEEHGALHRPRAHACHCGVDFYLKKDLAAHKNLVHSAQIDQEIAHLNFRQKRAIKNEIWLPHINYTGPKIKEDIKSEDEDDEEEEEEPRRGVRPRLKAQLIKKQKKKPRSTANNPKIKRIESKIKSLDIKPNSDKTYSCPHCQKVFKAKRNVEMHQVVHTGEKPYSCHLCEKKYTQPANLNRHLKKHMGIKEFCCLVCNKEFLQSGNFKTHIRTHTGEKPYSCTFCEKAFSDQSALKRHTRTHTGVKPYACIYCEMRFSDASGLIAHRRIHEGNKQHQCKDCSKWFYTNDALRKHVISIHERTKNYECKICSKSFALPGYLYIHNKNAHRENKDTYECDYCGYKSDIKYNLRYHIERKHMNMVFLCKECGRSFKHRNYLRNHQNQMHRRLQKYECDECAKIFNRKVDIYRHILSNHPSVNCSKCSRAFANSLDLKKHYLTGCVQCNDCGQRFPDKLKLKHHIFSLHLIYLYCHICNKSFHSTTELQQHKITANGDCKTTCEICNQPVSKRYMRQHLLIHMGDKRYSCAHCISSFSDKHALQRHLRLSHKYLYLVKKKKKLYR